MTTILRKWATHDLVNILVFFKIWMTDFGADTVGVENILVGVPALAYHLSFNIFFR